MPATGACQFPAHQVEDEQRSCHAPVVRCKPLAQAIFLAQITQFDLFQSNSLLVSYINMLRCVEKAKK